MLVPVSDTERIKRMLECIDTGLENIKKRCQRNIHPTHDLKQKGTEMRNNEKGWICTVTTI